MRPAWHLKARLGDSRPLPPLKGSHLGGLEVLIGTINAHRSDYYKFLNTFGKTSGDRERTETLVEESLRSSWLVVQLVFGCLSFAGLVFARASSDSKVTIVLAPPSVW